jgi:hypothetical protein
VCSNKASVDTAKLLCKEFLESKLTKSSPWLSRLNKPLLLLFFLAIGIATAFGWRYYKERYPSWYEEVRLSDGRVTIHQKREYFKNYGTNQSWVSIDLPELDGRQIWHSYLMPMRVDVVNGRVYVYGRPRGPRQLSIYGYPRYHIVAFKWEGSEFVRIPLMTVPNSILAEENVYSCISQVDGRVLSLKKKDEVWCPPSGEKGQFVKKIDLNEYRKHADAMAALSNWTNRSE